MSNEYMLEHLRSQVARLEEKQRDESTSRFVWLMFLSFGLFFCFIIVMSSSGKINALQKEQMYSQIIMKNSKILAKCKK